MTPVPPARRLPVWSLLPLAAVTWWVGGYLFWVLDGLEDRLNRH